MIEIDEKDFREIQDKLGDIRAMAITGKMTQRDGCIARLANITSWANEITVLLNSGAVVATPDSANSDTALTNNLSWFCKICGYNHKYTHCPGCDKPLPEIIVTLAEKMHTPPETTKFIERYSTWICEKCGYERDANLWPSMLDIKDKDIFLMCPGCGQEIVEFVPLVRDGV